jgi:hypothetical protein
MTWFEYPSYDLDTICMEVFQINKDYAAPPHTSLGQVQYEKIRLASWLALESSDDKECQGSFPCSSRTDNYHFEG